MIVLLDAGNTLVEIDYEYIARAIVAAGGDTTAADVRRAERHARVPLDAVLAGRSSEDRDTFRQYVTLVFERLQGREPREPELVFEALAARGNLWSVVEPTAAATLGRLREQGHRLGVVSNSDGSVERILTRLGLREFLEVVVDSRVVGVEKPDPRIFRHALEAMRVSPDEGVYVGDLPAIDLVGARAAGLRGILVDPLDLWADRVTEPRIRALADLPGLLEQIEDGHSSTPDV